MTARLCGAKTRAGGTCKRAALTGTNRCQFHGGKSPQVQAAIRRRTEEPHCRTLLERLGEPEPVGHPVEELLGIASEAKSWLGVLRERPSELRSFESHDRTGAEQEKAVVSLYERALDRTGRILHELARPRPRPLTSFLLRDAARYPKVAACGRLAPALTARAPMAGRSRRW